MFSDWKVGSVLSRPCSYGPVLTVARSYTPTPLECKGQQHEAGCNISSVLLSDKPIRTVMSETVLSSWL